MKKQLITLLCLLVGIVCTHAQYVVSGNATLVSGNNYKLTNAQLSQAGAVWFQNKISLASDLTINATINLGTSDGGADGIAFVLQPVCNGLGGIGGGIGYQGITPSVAVEFDTWQNLASPFGNILDPVEDHIGLNRNGTLNHTGGEAAGTISSFQTYSKLPDLENGANHTLLIEWIAASQNLKVTLDGTLRVNYTGDIVTNTFGGNRNVFWGFTAATGSAFNNQFVNIISANFVQEGSYLVTQPTCPSFDNGAIDLNPAGGVGPFTYAWSNGASSEDIIGLSAGTYTVAVRDANGCVSSFSIPVTNAADVEAPVLTGVPADVTVECDAVPSANTGVSSADNCGVVAENYYITPTVKTKLVHHWKADGDYADALGTANGTANGTVGFGTGILGGSAFKFDGSNASITTGTAGSLSGTGNFSVSAWVKTTSTTSMVIVGQRMTGTIDGEYLLKIGGNHNNSTLQPGKLYLLVYGSDSPVVDLFSTKSVNDGIWHQVIAERNGTNIRLYIDGVLDASGSTNVNVSFNPSIVTSIGKDVRDNGSFFNGMIDDVKVWSGNICSNTYEFDRVWTATDAAGNKTAAVQHVKVQDNTPPTLACPSNITVSNDANLCSAVVNYAATASDNCGTASVSYSIAPGSVFNVGTSTVTVTATDECGLTSTCSFTVTVSNDTPVINSVTGPAAPLALGASASVTVNFTDNNVSTASIGWDDASANDVLTNPSNSFTVSHTYANPGVYSVFVNLTDACGATASYEYQFVVIYDPNGGFVTGGGWINSPAGAYVADPSSTGKANFGFVAKYKKGSNVPDGNTEFQYHAGGLNFKSSIYDAGRLVISGATASFKGEGTINGMGNYGFLVSAIDGQVNGGGGLDKFRMKIWDKNNGNSIVYDNNLGLDENGLPTIALAGGSIVIHNPNKARLAVDEKVNAETDGLEVKVGLNPSPDEFKLTVQSVFSGEVTLNILNLQGQLIESRRQLALNTELSLGKNWQPGMYVAKIMQGKQQKLVKLLKIK